MPRPVARWLWAVLVVALPPAAAAQSPVKVTTPKEHFGFDIGDDYCLANYRQLTAYWSKLARESDRVALVDLGDTEEGRPQYMAVVTSPANHKRLDEYRTTARRLALADGVTEAEARKLAAGGKAVVWIDGGLHATETLCAQALIEATYRFASATDPETLRILDDVIVLFVHANPDGHDLVADHYMREKEPKKRSLTGLPRLYQKYAGHDNNRDFYANNLAETRNMNRAMYREWLPQIVLNQHQSGPPGTVLFCPPFRDPFNYRVDPLVVSGIDAVGAAVAQRLLAEGKPGATTRSGSRYSTWWNGGLRTACYFHNMIGLLTETIGSPTPMKIPFRPEMQLPKADYLAPVAPQEWHFRRSVEYSVSVNKAVLDYAARQREQLLFNIWRMGRVAIERGNADSWTVTPKVVAAAKGAKADDPKAFDKFFRDPARRDPRGYVIPADQPDFPTAVKFANTLLGSGVTVHRATAAFTAGGKTYPAGSLVVKAAQAFRAHALDMFEPQDHPNDFAYPGAPPTAPYDIAGWTLAYQMGLRFDRLLDGFDGPFAEMAGRIVPPPAKVTGGRDVAGFVLDPRVNDTFRVVNRLTAAGADVRRLGKPVKAGGVELPAGAFYVDAKSLAVLEKAATELGVPAFGVPAAPAGATVKAARIGLLDRAGGSITSGWTRWVLDRFEFPYTVIRSADLNADELRKTFDVIVLPEGVMGGTAKQPAKGDAPADEAPTPAGPWVPRLRAFLDAGGTVLALGNSTSLATHLKLGVENHLVAADAEGKKKPLGREKFYVPGSVLRTRVDTAHPLAWGLPADLDVMFSASPTFRLPAGESALTRVAWFDGKTPLRSGWAWGQEHLDGGVAVAEAKVGDGRLVLYGPQVLFRGQPHGTFKLFFNGIHRAAAVGQASSLSK